MDEEKRQKKLIKASFRFKEICRVAKDIKPDFWCIVASDQRLAFMEINMPPSGPGFLRKQIILNKHMHLEAYVGSNRISEKVFNIDNVTSVLELAKSLREFASLNICLGNKNFHRVNNMSSQRNVEYWRHMNCLLLYENDIARKEQCCDSCLSLNNVLTKKQRKKVIPYIYDEYPKLKKIKIEDNADVITSEVHIKEEIL